MATRSQPDDLAARLAAAPCVPSDFDLFSSNELSGEPGIYPQGSPMVPAAGAAPTEAGAIAALRDLGISDSGAALGDAALVARVPDVGVRAGLLALTVTVAAQLLPAFVDGDRPVQSIRYGEPSSPGRIVGPPSGEAATTAGAGRQRALRSRAPRVARGIARARPAVEP